MDKLIDRFSEVMTNILDNPECIYHYLVRCLQLFCVFDILLLVRVFRHADLEFFILREAVLEILPWFLVYALLPLFAQLALKLMNPPSSRGVSALFLLSAVGIFAAPIISIALLITIFTPPFQRLIKGNEPEWYTKLQKKLGLKDNSDLEKH